MNNQLRNRELLDLAYEVPCTVRLRVCDGTNGEPAHSNQARHGKGGAMKAHDCFFAAACRSCHREIDQGRTMDRETKFAVWDSAHIETFQKLRRRGLVAGVVPSGAEDLEAWRSGASYVASQRGRVL